MNLTKKTTNKNIPRILFAFVHNCTHVQTKNERWYNCDAGNRRLKISGVMISKKFNGANQFYIFATHCSRSSTDRIMVSGTIDMSSNLVGSTKKPLILMIRGFLVKI